MRTDRIQPTLAEYYHFVARGLPFRSEACATAMNESRRVEDLRHNVIASTQELDGWQLISLQRHKAGVLRYTAKRATQMGLFEMQSGYAKDGVFTPAQVTEFLTHE
jgi:hypothetical protein